MPVIDLTGQKFGELKVVRIDHLGKRNEAYWFCECDCGDNVVVRASNLRTGNTKSCGKRLNLVGQKYGRLTVISFDHDRRSVSHWLCKCDCGKERIISIDSLRGGKSKSCGCLQGEITSIRSRVDGRLVSARKIWNTTYKNGCSFEKFLELSQLACHYCGVEPNNRFNIYKSDSKRNAKQDWINQSWFIYNGLDRVDPFSDHSENNIVPCCIRCNRAKSNYTIQEFEEWIIKIYNNLRKNKTNNLE